MPAPLTGRSSWGGGPWAATAGAVRKRSADEVEQVEDVAEVAEREGDEPVAGEREVREELVAGRGRVVVEWLAAGLRPGPAGHLRLAVPGVGPVPAAPPSPGGVRPRPG